MLDQEVYGFGTALFTHSTVPPDPLGGNLDREGGGGDLLDDIPY
jgi:hypothetical protein